METHSVQLFGKNIISYFKHHIMALSYENRNDIKMDLVMESVTDCTEKMIDGPYSINMASRIVKRNKGKCEVFVFYYCGVEVGTLSVMYKGGNDIEYKIRNTDAFIYNVSTLEKYRGRGYAVVMINMLMDYLHNNSINTVYLAVSTNNTSAIRCYQKAGFVKKYDSSFIRVLKINIPYKTI